MTGGIILTKLRDYGQIKEGDALLIFDGKKVNSFHAMEVLHEGTDKEEVVVDQGRNKYFIVDLYLTGESWAKRVCIAKHISEYKLAMPRSHQEPSCGVSKG